MKKSSKYGILMIGCHTIVTLLHGLAHQRVQVPLSLFQGLFVGIVITLAPLVAAYLLWKGFGRTGGVILLLSMIGAFLFGLYNHFWVVSPDHVSQIPMTSWGIIFLMTTVFLALTEGVGIGAGVWILKDSPHKELIL